MPGRGGQRYDRSDSEPLVQGLFIVAGDAGFAIMDFKTSSRCLLQRHGGTCELCSCD